MKRAHDLSYAKDLLFNVNHYVHPFITADLFAQWKECRSYSDREDWFFRMEATLDLYQFGRVRSEDERYVPDRKPERGSERSDREDDAYR